jgi:hypothetical protein
VKVFGCRPLTDSAAGAGGRRPKVEFIINLKTAKTLGLEVPSGLVCHRRRGDRMTMPMNRRQLIALLGGAPATWPLAARAQQAAMPVVGYLDPSAPEPSIVAAFLKGLSAARALGLQTVVLNASTSSDIDMAFASLARERADALFIGPDAFFDSRRLQLAILAVRNATPTAYPDSESPRAGGLISYGTDVIDVYRQVGVYSGRILKGAKPADLPVEQVTKFELVINLITAKALGIDVPPSLIARADEVIE